MAIDEIDATPGVAQSDDARRMERCLRTFIGPNAEAYIDLWSASKTAGRLKWTFNWAMFLAPFVWLGYRKMYGVFAGALWLLVVLVAMSPSMVRTLFTGILPAFALLVMHVYLWRAERAVRPLDGLGLPDAEKIERLAAMGGTSRVGAVLGVMVTLGWLALLFGSAFDRNLPASCSDARAVTAARHAYAERSGRSGDGGRVTLSEVEEGVRIGPMRVCGAVFQLDGVERRAAYLLSTDGRETERLTAKIGFANP